MKVIRQGVFETNSSSTHSITMCNREEYNEWVQGKVYWNYGTFYEMPKNYKNFTDEQWITLLIEKGFIYEEDEEYWVDTNITCWDKTREKYNSIEEAYNSQKEWLIDYYMYECEDLYSVNIYEEVKEDRYETYWDNYTTPNGEEVIAFGYYGNDW